ncbi:hypothetical protein DRW41_17935 [Neobacillus piezotolerans]|uniref:Uncharacterized protein n=1 Tax=Neobacillus piezotolerans TaxID=2259171 RepID=A0A3D8GMW5_9BACI|nr:hypothetical protein DRW41_17935 [Neobacillus piezotolerans]
MYRKIYILNKNTYTTILLMGVVKRNRMKGLNFFPIWILQDPLLIAKKKTAHTKSRRLQNKTKYAQNIHFTTAKPPYHTTL